MHAHAYMYGMCKQYTCTCIYSTYMYTGVHIIVYTCTCMCNVCVHVHDECIIYVHCTISRFLYTHVWNV